MVNLSPSYHKAKLLNFAVIIKNDYFVKHDQKCNWFTLESMLDVCVMFVELPSTLYHLI